jgi:3-oxoacyl-[acyl-carrier protein] reductase
MALALEGQVAFITGGGSGLGAASAERLARDGAIVVINDLDARSASEVAERHGGLSYAFDVTDSVAMDSALDDTVSRLGRLDIMVNNAGIAPRNVSSKTERMAANAVRRMEGDLAGWEPMNNLVDMSDEDWDRMIRVHLYGAFNGTRAALRHMTPSRSGAIVNISSILGLMPSSGAAHYSVAKAGIIALTKSVADEVAPLGIRVNAVCPGYIDTPLLTPFSEQMKAGIVMRIGMGHMGEPVDIAEMVRFLSGPESRYCTGDVYKVSGGYMG